MEENEVHTKFFSLKVLTCIYDLQMGSDNVNSVNTAGITIDEIVEQMCRRFVTDGDVESQVLISLKQICHKGLVGRVKDRYKLVGPMARILLMTHRNCERKRQIEKIQRIFFNNCVGNTTATIPRAKSTQSHSHNHSEIQVSSNKRSRTKELDVPETSKRSKTKEIETRQHSRQSTGRNRNSRSETSRESQHTKKSIIRDLVDFLQCDSCSSASSLSSYSKGSNESLKHDEIITLLPENKNYKCYSKSTSNYNCMKDFSKK